MIVKGEEREGVYERHPAGSKGGRWGLCSRIKEGPPVVKLWP